ncbi:hypothetical protein STTU_1869 [Streptomyces sp. Tu6071]|nr:hypothetical protein STTU_1869 [Streptomyces sp. Tu6071]
MSVRGASVVASLRDLRPVERDGPLRLRGPGLDAPVPVPLLLQVDGDDRALRGGGPRGLRGARRVTGQEVLRGPYVVRVAAFRARVEDLPARRRDVDVPELPGAVEDLDLPHEAAVLVVVDLGREGAARGVRERGGEGVGRRHLPRGGGLRLVLGGVVGALAGVVVLVVVGVVGVVVARGVVAPGAVARVVVAVVGVAVVAVLAGRVVGPGTGEPRPLVRRRPRTRTGGRGRTAVISEGRGGDSAPGREDDGGGESGEYGLALHEEPPAGAGLMT